MRKRIIVLILVVIFAFTVCVGASASMKGQYIYPSLSFSGTTAICGAEVCGGNINYKISVTMRLWHNGLIYKTWESSGTYRVTLSETAAAVSGETYMISVNVKINGVTKPLEAVTKVCP